MDRRSFLLLPSLVLAESPDAWGSNHSLAGRMEILERESGGRIGVCAFDSERNRTFAFHADSRFAMASTFKVLLASAILRQVDVGQITLTQELRFAQNQVVAYSPVTSSIANGLILVRQACEAIIQVSDNTAANLLLDCIGGPPGFTRFVRGLGDEVTRLDRFETDLNLNLTGDARDTTTPRAMLNSMHQVLLGGALSPESKNQLIDWLIGSTTGSGRIRAGLPAGWRVGDKTGTGGNGAVNDVAIFWPLDKRPVLITIYLSDSTKSTTALSAIHARIAEMLISDWLNI
jgi:beta-lactamase class A